MKIRNALLAATLGAASALFAMPALAKNILVSNLSWSTSEQELQNLFTPYGWVSSVTIITDKLNNNRSKGYGYVEMPDSVEADAAIAALNNSDFSGKKIIVKDATRSADTSSNRPVASGRQRAIGGGGGSGGGGGYGR